MDKEKEIQEMARVVCLISNCVDNFGCDNCEYTTEHCRKQCVFARNAEEVFNAGYRKADEVHKEVLDEFYNTHFCAYMQAYDEEVKEPCVEGPCPHFKGVEDIRKETAKAILQELYDITFERKDFFGDSDEAKGVIDRAEILHMAKMYGVEEDE